LITVTLYSSRDCALCDQVRLDLGELQAEVPHRLVEIFVEDDPDLHRQYFDKVPVIEAGPYRKTFPFNRTELAVTLRAARDRMESLERVDDAAYRARVERGQTVTGGDRFSYWFSRNYIWLINLLLLLYVSLPFVAPTLLSSNLSMPASIIYTAYSPLCHQLGFRSFFLFGEQAYYPREAAGITGVMTFQQATGIPEDDLLAARQYRGEPGIGYKVALCERDVAIYGAMLAFGVLFAATGKRSSRCPDILGADRYPSDCAGWFLPALQPAQPARPGPIAALPGEHTLPAGFYGRAFRLYHGLVWHPLYRTIDARDSPRADQEIRRRFGAPRVERESGRVSRHAISAERRHPLFCL
jgi:hypothetical protein